MKKPWDSKNKKDYFYKEWANSLEKANLINLKKLKKPKKWSNWKIKIYSLYLKTRCFLYYHKDFLHSQIYLNYINKKIGLFGIRLKNHYPKTYYYLKKIRIKNFNLIKELTLSDFKLRYKGSLLGLLWSFLKPLLMLLILYTVFSFIIKL